MKQTWHVSSRGDITIREPVNADGSIQRTVLHIPYYVLRQALANSDGRGDGFSRGGEIEQP